MPEIKKKRQTDAGNDASGAAPSMNGTAPSTNGQVDYLAPYSFWGVNLEPHGMQAVGDCPFCTREGKFSVRRDTGLWRCLICGTGSEKGGGNVYTFIRQLWEGAAHVEDPEDRGVSRDTMALWDVRWCHITGEWMLGARNLKGRLDQLYAYRKDHKTGKRILMATTSVPHQIFGMQFFDPKKPEVWIMEGPWDAMVAWDSLRSIKKASSGYSLTGSEAASMLGKVNIIAVPGCNVFKEEWAAILDGKTVSLLFDSDHPRVVNGKVFKAGYDGMKRLVGTLCKAPATPKEVRYVEWGPEGYDISRPSGFDVRDLLTSEPIGVPRGPRITELLSKVKPIPSEWVTGSTAGSSSSNGSVSLEPIPCNNWKDLDDAWRIAMDWHPGLRGMMACGLACIASTMFKGSQLWMKMVGPPASGKTTVCEAWSVSKKYVKAVSTLTGFHSGIKSFEGGKADNSLLVLCKNKTLVIKDGDTLMQAMNKDSILAEARDVYDRVSRTHYRHGLANDYEGLSMTFIICGTEALRSLDASEVGERLLDWIVIDKMEHEDERRIGRRVAFNAIRQAKLKSDEGALGSDSEEIIRAKMMTGGYIEWLYANSEELLPKIEFSEEAMDACQDLAMFTAYVRARPSKKQEESQQRELSFRLIEQMCRLAQFLALVFNKPSVDESVITFIKKSALATSRGRTLELMRHLYRFKDDGASTARLALLTNQMEEKEKTYLEFIRHLGAVELYNPTSIKGNVKWRMSRTMRDLYQKVIGD